MESLIEEDPNLLSGCVHREVLVILKTHEFRGIADYLKMFINLSWVRLARGRTMKRISYKDQTIFLLSLDPRAQQVGTVTDEATLNDAMEAEGVGRVSADPYELEFARKLMAKFGTTIC